ncbi:MAG TPA: ABC transporter permease [Candidatus Limnocylindrales bacterium]|nr:ABC transporter permease [Candidatus Limnocylindrales bacterium]
MEIRWDWIAENLDTILLAIWQHLVLTVVPLAIGFVISLGLAIWAVREPRVYGPITAITGILYTIPSLAAFALLVPVFGFSMLVAFIPLTTYTLLILFRNIVAGFQGVPREVLEAADGMGYRPRERLLRVEIPLAVPLMITGVRLAAVTLIGLATVASILGSSFGGLGQLITEGLQTFFPTKYVLGGVLSVLLAVTVDLLLVRVERLVTPWARTRTDRAVTA